MNTTLPRETRPRIKAWDGDGIKADFDAASVSRHWTLGYRSLDADHLSCQVEVTGRIPEGLRGRFYRNGPARHERSGKRYAHRWDGDGMVQMFDISDGSVSHLGRYVQTHKHRTETAQHQLLFSGFGTHIPGSDPERDGVDAVNPANISVLSFDGELLALWEAGSAYRLDPLSLDTLGVKTWSGESQGSPFSAHPRVEPDGTMWNFGVDPLCDRLTIYHVPSRGRLCRSHVIKIDQLPPTHDFAVTDRHLVFLFPPMVLDQDRLSSGASFAESCHWTPTMGMRALTVDKSDWSQKWYHLPAGCLFHMANAWEEGGRVCLHYMRSEGPMSLMAGWSVMRGQYRHFDGARLTEAQLDPSTGEATQRSLGRRESEFPLVDALDVGRRHGTLLCLERSSGRPSDLPGFDEVAFIDIARGTSEEFRYGDDWLVDEHVLARAQGEERARWIVGTALDLRSQTTVLSIFEASRLAAGPVAQARLPYALPLGLHGTYVPQDDGR